MYFRKLRAEKLESEEQDYIRLYNYYVETTDKTRAEGREEGRAEGRKEERQKAYQEKIESAKEMRISGLSLEDIHRFTKLPIEIIEKL